MAWGGVCWIFAAAEITHLNHEETVAKMRHPVLGLIQIWATRPVGKNFDFPCSLSAYPLPGRKGIDAGHSWASGAGSIRHRARPTSLTAKSF